MKRLGLLIVFLSLAATLALTGCGGSGGSGTSSSITGNWAGTFTSTGDSGPMSGNLTLAILSTGAASGSLQITSPSSLQGALTGTITNNHDFSGIITYPSATPIQARGTFNIQSSDHLIGSIDIYGEPNRVTDTTSFDLRRQ